ncbi:conserved protein of unknown function [Xenorhabdus bovienii]|uniref:Uncharacterized protein n=1 Tax=Xenorhabdus bovienii TaxID=40576 RepID=A0A0B6X522_XENBV|nr:conserved protein of unknown function [Xenorhabdus bovienii]
MKTTSYQWLFRASQPYCLQINMTPPPEPMPVQLCWLEP